jgi:hypothetical protein
MTNVMTGIWTIFEGLGNLVGALVVDRVGRRRQLSTNLSQLNQESSSDLFSSSGRLCCSYNWTHRSNDSHKNIRWYTNRWKQGCSVLHFLDHRRVSFLDEGDFYARY